VISLEDLRAIVDASLDVADDTAVTIQLDAVGGIVETRKHAAKSMLQSLPPFSKLKLGTAVKVPASILFVDMRGSTRRALEVGPRATYLTMHALLPALARIVTDCDGYVVGFRGDGLFAAFGIDSHGNAVSAEKFKLSVGAASACGLTMIEAVEKVINPALEMYNVTGDVQIGVGLDAGEVVITRIGLMDGFEITAYGNAVNNAAKLCAKGNNEVIISTYADSLIPATPGGTLLSKYVVVNDSLAAQVTSRANYLQ
jgi:class 3 adenylate cyclase